MIDFELFSKIKHYHEHRALTPAQIARELELDPRTVARWLTQQRFMPCRNPQSLQAIEDVPFRRRANRGRITIRLLHRRFDASRVRWRAVR